MIADLTPDVLRKTSEALYWNIDDNFSNVLNKVETIALIKKAL